MSQLARLIPSSGPGSGTVKSLTGNTGGAVGPDGTGTIFVVTANSTPVFAGNAGTFTETLDFNLSNLVLGSSLPSVTGGAQNVGVGSLVLNSVTSGSQNTAVGYRAGTSITTAPTNTLVGAFAGNAITTGASNTAVGQSALQVFTTGAANAGSNAAFGIGALGTLLTGVRNTGIAGGSGILTGSYNIFLGQANGTGSSGNNYTGAESANILIGSLGTLGESNTIRIGSAGSGTGQQNRFFAAGIDGVNVGSVATVVTESGNQLGTAVITAGSNITVTPAANLITIAATTPAAVATSYQTDAGVAVPAANVLNVLGGLNIDTTGAGNTVTVLASPDQYLTNYRVANATPFLVNATDFYITVDTSTIAITIQLPDAPTIYRRFIIKDSAGNASVRNVTVTTVSGIKFLDAATTFVMNTNYQAAEFVYDNFGYQIF